MECYNGIIDDDGVRIEKKMKMWQKYYEQKKRMLT